MEQNTVPGTPAPTPNTFPDATSGGGGGKIVIVGIVLLIIAAAIGWYLMQGGGMDLLAPAGAPSGDGATSMEMVTAEGDAATEAFATQGTSDELGDIEADLQATDLGSLDELNQI